MGSVSANDKSDMDNYMRSQCDAFLQRLEVKMLAQVSQVINTVKSEMYEEISKTVGAMVTHVNASFPTQSKEADISVDIPMDSSVVSDVHSDFILPRLQRKRLEKREKRREINPSVMDCTVDGFSGVTPDVFLYRCSKDTKAEIIKDSLSRQGINVKSVELKSHKDAETRSFKLSVETLQDFDKVMSRRFIPRCVKVKRFIHYKNSKDGKRLQPQAPSMTSFMNHPKPSCVDHSNVDSSYDNMSVITMHPNDQTDLVKLPSSSTTLNDIANCTLILHQNRDLYEECKRDLSFGLGVSEMNFALPYHPC